MPYVLRAFVMVIMIEAAYALRRPINPVASVATSALLALLVDPMLLFNASFQMSYGIVAGLILLGLPLAERLQVSTAPFQQLPRVAWDWPHHVIHWLHRAASSALGIGLATALVSSLCGVLYFELFTPGALLANVVLIPVSSLSLWAGFLSLLCGLLHLDWLTVVFNHAAALTLWLLEWGLRWLLKIPGMFFHGHFLCPAAGYVAFGGLLALLLYGYARLWESWRAAWWLPFLWTILALAALVAW